jgi:hypothetical protein
MALAIPQAIERLLATPTINARLPSSNPIGVILRHVNFTGPSVQNYYPVYNEFLPRHDKRIMSGYAFYGALCAAVWATACNAGPAGHPWNSPYPPSQSHQNIYYDAFEERPKHLDPVSSYSANEYVFLGQIYEPPLQYHFLKRPYELPSGICP